MLSDQPLKLDEPRDYGYEDVEQEYIPDYLRPHAEAARFIRTRLETLQNEGPSTGGNVSDHPLS